MINPGFSHSITDYAGALTENTHRTLDWLVNNKYITKAQWEELTSSIIVVPIQNKKTFGQKILARFFGNDRDDDEGRWVFPIVRVDNYDNTPTPKGKPKLAIVSDTDK